MRNTGGSTRSKSNKDKGSNKSIQNTHTVKSEGPPLKAIQATAEQLALNNLIHGKEKDTEDSELKRKIHQIMDLTGCSQDKAEIALHDNQNDMDKAVNMVLEGKADESEWQESGKKKKKPKQEQPPPVENNVDSKPDRRENKEKIDNDGQEQTRDDFDSYRGNRDQSDNYKRRRNDNKPPRLSRGRGRPDRAGDRPDRDEDRDRDRGFERGRGRGRGGPRRGGRGASTGGGTFRSNPRFEKNNTNTFDNGPQIDTWTNETAVIGEKEPKISNWGDSKDDWNEDIDSWSGSLAETKVFTASASNAPEPQNSVQMPPQVDNTLSNTFDLGVLYQKHTTNDISAEASYISQFNQQATESIKNSIGIGSGPSSLSSQTVSNVSALVSLQQNAVLQENMGSSLTANDLSTNSLVGNGLGGTSLGSSSLGGSGLGGGGLGGSSGLGSHHSGLGDSSGGMGGPASGLGGPGSGLVGSSSGLGGPSLGSSSLGGSSLGTNGLVGTSLGSSLTQTSLPVNTLTGGGLNSTSLSVNNLTGNSLTGTGLNGTGLTGSLTGNSLSSVSQSMSAGSAGIPSVTASQNAMLQQRPKPQRSKLPPPSKIPASAVEMPGHMMMSLDVEFGSLEFGTDSAPFSFGGNESVSSAFSSTASSSSSTINHANAQMGQVPLSKGSESMMTPANLEQNSPHNGSLYQSTYNSVTPTKQPTVDNNTGMTTPESLQMHSAATDLKSSQLMSGQSPQGTLSTTKIDSSLNSYSSSTSYQPAGYQSHKPSTGYSSSTKSGTYPGSQFQTSSNPSQSNTGQYSSQYRSTNQSQFTAGGNQYQSGSQYQSPPSGYQPQTGYQSSQTVYQSNQSQYPSNSSQFQNFQSGSTFQNQSNYPSNQTGQNILYQGSNSSTPYTSQSQSNSLYSQSSSHTGSYGNQSYLNRDHTGGSGSSYPTSVTQAANSAFKDSQSGASSYRDNVSSSKTNDSQSDSSAYSRDSQSASSFSDSQSMAYNRDSQSVGDSFGTRDSGSNSYKRDTKSASGSYPRDSQTSVIDNSSYKRDSQSGGGSFSSGRDNQTYKDASSASGYRDTQPGSSSFSNQSNSYTRDSSQTGLASGASQSQSAYSAKNFRNSQDLTSTTLQTSSLSGSKLADNFSKMSVKEPSLENRQSASSQFDVATTSSSKSTASTTSMSSLTSITTTVTSSVSSVTTVTSSNMTKVSTFPTISSASSKAPPNLPPGVPLMTQQYIMGQAGTLPFYGMQQPMYANIEDLQYFQRGMPPLPANNMYDFSSAAAAAGLGIPPTTLTSNSTQQTIPSVPYSGTGDSAKLPRVEAQSPTGSLPTSQQSATGQAHQQPYFYSYIYPPSIIPGAGFQIPMIMPQVTNAAHTGTPANTQYQQKSYSSHHVPYGTNKVYDDLTQQTPDFTKSPYGSAQTQPKANSSVTTGSAASDIPMSAYGKTHAQAFDKQGFHASTPPPFNLQMAAGQLATGTQAGPLGAPAGPYGAPFVPMMTHQPHSQMLHHALQDTSSSSRGSQQTGSHSLSKTTTKSYSNSSWGAY